MNFHEKKAVSFRITSVMDLRVTLTGTLVFWCQWNVHTAQGTPSVQLSTTTTWYKRFTTSKKVHRVKQENFPFWGHTRDRELWPIYSMWSTHRSSMRFIHVSTLKILCLHGFQGLTSADLEWPLTPTKAIGIICSIWNPLVKYEIHPHFCSCVCTKSSEFDLRWPLTSIKNNRDHLLNVEHPAVKYEIHPCFPSWDELFLQSCRVWPVLTSDDLWPSQKTIGVIYSIWGIHWSSMRFIHVSFLEILCVQCFWTFTSGDLKIQMTFNLHHKQ